MKDEIISKKVRENEKLSENITDTIMSTEVA